MALRVSGSKQNTERGPSSLSLPSPCSLSLFPLPLPLNLLPRSLSDPPSNAHEHQGEDNWRSNKEHAIAKMEEEEAEAHAADASGGGIDVFGRNSSSPATLESQVRIRVRECRPVGISVDIWRPGLSHRDTRMVCRLLLVRCSLLSSGVALLLSFSFFLPHS